MCVPHRWRRAAHFTVLNGNWEDGFARITREEEALAFGSLLADLRNGDKHIAVGEIVWQLDRVRIQLTNKDEGSILHPASYKVQRRFFGVWFDADLSTAIGVLKTAILQYHLIYLQLEDDEPRLELVRRGARTPAIR